MLNSMRQWQTEWKYCTFTHTNTCKEERASTQTNTHNNKCWIWSNHVVYLNVEIWDALNFVCGRNFSHSFSCVSPSPPTIPVIVVDIVTILRSAFCCWCFYYFTTVHANWIFSLHFFLFLSCSLDSQHKKFHIFASLNWLRSTHWIDKINIK